MGSVNIYMLLFIIWIMILTRSSYKPGKFYEVRDFLILFSGITVIFSLVLYVIFIDAMTEKEFDFICIDRVEYITTGITGEGLTPHFKSDGTLYACED